MGYLATEILIYKQFKPTKMKSLLFQVDFQVKTSTYSVVNESFTTVVLAESYDDAANIVRRKFSVYKGFKLDAIKPKGIPEIAVNQIVNLPKRELHD